MSWQRGPGQPGVLRLRRCASSGPGPRSSRRRSHDGDDRARVEWARDSAFRFFPLLRHDEFGLTLHPFDLATNKVLALVGRLEVRDWVDVIACDAAVQPLGYLAWAASAKDPGFGPGAILEAAARSSRYSADEVAELAFDGPPPDAAELSRSWHQIARSRPIHDRPAATRGGRCVRAGQHWPAAPVPAAPAWRCPPGGRRHLSPRPHRWCRTPGPRGLTPRHCRPVGMLLADAQTRGTGRRHSGAPMRFAIGRAS